MLGELYPLEGAGVRPAGFESRALRLGVYLLSQLSTSGCKEDLPHPVGKGPGASPLGSVFGGPFEQVRLLRGDPGSDLGGVRAVCFWSRHCGATVPQKKVCRNPLT